MSYQFPDDETLVRYLALLRAAILEARMAASSGEPQRAVRLLDAIENVPDLLQRWPDMREDVVRSDIDAYERAYLAETQPLSAILDGVGESPWLQTPAPKPDVIVEDPLAALRVLIDRWCARRDYGLLRDILPAWLANNGLTDGWGDLRNAVRTALIHAGLPDDERATLRDIERRIDRALSRRG